MNADHLLPYQIIARFCGLEKEWPDDAHDKMWVDDNGKRYVITYLGFVPAEQYNYKLLCEQAERECDDLNRSYIALKKDFEEYKVKSGIIPQTDVVGKRSKKYLLSIIKLKTMTAEEKLVSLEQQLRQIK